MIPNFGRTVQATIVSDTGTKIFRHDISTHESYNLEFESEWGASNLTGMVKIWNPNKQTILALEEKTAPARITLNAGYGQEIGLILSGDVIGRETKTGTDGADSWVSVKVSNHTMMDLVVTQSWTKVPISTIVNDLAAMVGYVADVKITKDEIQSSFGAKGTVIQSLNALAKIATDPKTKRPAKFTTQLSPGGKLQFYNEDLLSSAAPKIILNSHTGLIGKPVFKGVGSDKKKYWLIKSILLHTAHAGSSITVSYTDRGTPMTIEGIVTGGKHRGGTYSEEFVTEVDVRATV